MDHNAKLFRQLEELRMSDPDVFLSLKLNVNSICEKLQLRRLEDFFFEQKGDAHTIYEIAAEAQEFFGQSLNAKSQNARQSFFVVSPDGGCAVLYQVRPDFRVIPCAKLFGEERIADILETFEAHLTPVVQDDLDECDDPAEIPQDAWDDGAMFEGGMNDETF